MKTRELLEADELDLYLTAVFRMFTNLGLPQLTKLYDDIEITPKNTVIKLASSSTLVPSIRIKLTKMKMEIEECVRELLRNREFCYAYALKVVGGPWAPAEPVLKRDAKFAILYAKFVLKDRFPEGEPAILDAFVTANLLDYLRLIKGRWPELEQQLLKFMTRYAAPWATTTSGFYARENLRDRWPEAEPYIAKNGLAAMNYAVDVIKGRWPEAEPRIKAEGYLSEYNRRLGL